MELNFTDILVFLADSQTNVRRDILAGLRNFGFQHIEDFKRFDDLLDALQGDEYPDLIIVDADMPGANIAKFIKALRHNSYGNNPYVPLIVTTWNPEQRQVRALAFAGIDLLVAKPMSPAMLMDRIKSLTVNRKPFIVTSDYIGPDRRKDEDRKKPAKPGDPKTLEVPNTMSMKARGLPMGEPLEMMISRTHNAINNGKLEGHARTIAMMVKVVLPALAGEEDWDEAIDNKVQRLLTISKDVAKRLRKSDFAHIADLCKQLHSLIHTLAHEDDLPTDRDLRLLDKLSMALLKATRPDAGEGDLAASIASSVANYQKFNRK